LLKPFTFSGTVIDGSRVEKVEGKQVVDLSFKDVEKLAEVWE
jgi:hypothetical protein